MTQAALAILDTKGQYKVEALWPATGSCSIPLEDTFTEIARKQRIHLAKLDPRHLLLGHPLIVNGKYAGAVILCIADASSQDTKHIVESLTRALVWLQFLIYEHDKTSSSPDTAVALKSPSPLLENLLNENSLQEAEISLVNLLATQVHSVRVSLGWQTAQGISLEAVAFSANFDRRTQAMQLIVDAMNEASDQATDIHYAAQQEHPAEASTQIRLHHQQLLQQQSLQSVHSFLLRKDKRIVGVITVEKALQQLLSSEQQAFIESQLPLITRILDLKKSATAGLWQRLKQIVLTQTNRWFSTQRALLRFIAIALLIFIAVLFIPADYHISSDASLKSAYKHLLVSPQDGYLKTIKVRPGDQVKKGDLLAQLNDDELTLQRRKLASQVQQYQQEYDTALANSNRVAAAIADTQVDQANIQLRLVEQQLNRIQLLAPSDGIVVSDDISQTLGAPVKQGDMLFEIAAIQGYLVQLLVDERDIAELKVGQAGHVKLTSLPQVVFEFQIKTITPLSEIQNGRNYFKVDATLSGETGLLRPGMTGTGKINVGKHSLGWIWFHDLWHWLRLKLWW
ncbi:MAG TPA: efflux RND transporter periplasmic adaptor subunit [Cellvibrio sp.]|nr:efflux RND transporter periplasmic adaptor subunit [Cellvibrio sp.]